MGNKNHYIAQQRSMQQDCIDLGEKFGIQKMWDYLCIALHDPKVMGKDTFGEKRLERLFEALQRLANEYSVAFSQEKEADYYQDLMYRQLRDIYGDRAEPFYVRYPDLKKIKYDKARKGWK